MNELERIDAALIDLRHLWTAPPHIEDPVAGRIEMSTIWVADSLHRESPQTVTDLAAALGVAHSTASRLVARAEAAGVVERRPDPEDQRRTVVTLTAAGQRLASAALAYRLDVLGRWTRDFSPADRQAFAQLLTRFANQRSNR